MEKWHESCRVIQLEGARGMILLSGSQLTIEQMKAILYEGASIGIADEAKNRVLASRARVEKSCRR